METPATSPTPSRKPWYIALVFAALAGIAFYYWRQNQGYETTDNAQLDGNIVTVKASVTAYLDKIYFADNQLVKQGDTLLRFNTVALLARVRQAQAALANARAATRVSGSRASASVQTASASAQLTRSSEQEVVAARATVDRARQDFERSGKLLAVKGITQQQFEAARSQLTIAQAGLAQAVSRQLSTVATAQGQRATARSEQAQIGTAEATVAQRQAELQVAEEDLRHAYVLAPCAGIVTKRGVQLGQFVAAGQNLCAVVDVQHLWVAANVKETQLRAIRAGQPVAITVDAFPDLQLTGHVASFGGATGAKFALLPPDNATGNFVKVVQRVPLRIALDPAPATTPAALYPGLSAGVKINVQ